MSLMQNFSQRNSRKKIELEKRTVQSDCTADFFTNFPKGYHKRRCVMSLMKKFSKCDSGKKIQLEKRTVQSDCTADIFATFPKDF